MLARNRTKKSQRCLCHACGRTLKILGWRWQNLNVPNYAEWCHGDCKQARSMVFQLQPKEHPRRPTPITPEHYASFLDCPIHLTSVLFFLDARMAQGGHVWKASLQSVSGVHCIIAQILLDIIKQIRKGSWVQSKYPSNLKYLLCCIS